METTITKKIRCSGKLHQISIVPSGPIILHNHTRAELAAERILIALGGEECRCLQFLRAWRNNDRLKLPTWAREPFDNLRWVIRRQRNWHRRPEKNDPLSYPIIMRIDEKLRKIINETIQTCNYKTQIMFTIPIPIFCFITHIGIGYRPHIRKIEGANLDIKIMLNTFRWHNHVFKYGLAVVSGSFVLDVLSQDETGYTVLAGRQNADLSINTNKAHINIDAITGAKTLQWLDNPKSG